ncbi:hypothetical protein V7068_15715 [Bacillus sp. JJ634]
MYDIRKLVQEIDKEHYLKELEAKSKKSKKGVQQKLDKLNTQMDVKEDGTPVIQYRFAAPTFE